MNTTTMAAIAAQLSNVATNRALRIRGGLRLLRVTVVVSADAVGVRLSDTDGVTLSDKESDGR
jgi:hypothetical protein